MKGYKRSERKWKKRKPEKQLMVMVESKRPTTALTDAERFPLISDFSFLERLRHDAYAPVFNFKSGDRLGSEQLARVHTYAQEIRSAEMSIVHGTLPAWMEPYLKACVDQVPFYKDRSTSFHEQPTISRGDIAANPWLFVPNSMSLDDLLVYKTSGTTGAAMDVLFDSVSQACWIPQLQSVLDKHKITLDDDAQSVAIAMICSQSATLTYASLSTYLNGAGVLKLNLNEREWKDLNHRVLYLEKYNPQVLTGDPFAFVDLLNLKPKIKPKVLVSSAMKLTQGLREVLEAYFSCPVVDIYSLTECRMVAVAEGDRYRPIRPELYLEVFDKDLDVALPYGERGELVISGGNNPFLPMIRYRTGDFCKLVLENGIPYLVDLEARKPVVFYTKSGTLVNNIEISRRMTRYTLAGFEMHQKANHDVVFKGWGHLVVEADVLKTLAQIFGEDLKIEVSIHPLDFGGGFKSVTYSSDFEFDHIIK